MKNAWKKFLAVTLSAAMLMSNNVMTLAADEEIPTEQPSSVVEETVQKDQDGQNAAEKTPEIVTEPEEQQPVQEQPAENVSADLTGEKKEEIPAPEEVAEESTVAETENLAQRSQENVFSEDAKGDSKESVATSAPNENIQEKVKKQSPIRRAVTLNNGEQDLTGITGTDGLTITANPTTNVDRSQKIDFSAIFTINDLEKAKQATTWVYDLSDFVKDSKAFSQLSGEIGAVMEGDDKAGSYEIKNNAVYLHIDPVWLSEKSEGVKGTFQFSAQLDADKIGQREGDTFNFPGTSSPVTMNYEKVDIGVNNKRVTAADGTAEDSSGVIALRKTADGTYKLKYSMDVTPNANLTTLKLTDIMSAGQTLDTDSVVLYDGGNNYNKLSASFTDGENGSKVLDLAQVLKSNGSSVKKDCNYKVEYTVTIESKDLNTTLEKTNKASWAFDGGSKAGGETSVKTKKELTISKAVTTTDNANSQDVDEAEYSYTITVGEQGEDLSGYVLTDTMSDNQLVKGDITLNYGGKTVTVEPSSDFTDSTFVAGTNNTKQLFTYSFPKGTTGPCTVTYTTKLPKVEDAKETLIKWQDITNTSTVTDTNGDTGTASTKKSHNFTQPRVDKAWNISKAFKDYSAHDDGDVLNWTVTIKSDNDIYSADTPIYLYEDEFTYGYGAYATYNKQMTVLWDQITVASAVEGGTVPEIHHQLENDTYGRDCIKITGMTGPIVLTIPTKLASGDHYIDTDGRSFYAKNKAGFKDDSVYKNAEAYTEHQISEYRMSKDVKYDRDTKEYTWTVSINPDQRVISPDQKEVLFRDDIPEGMELVDFGNVAGKQLYIDSNYRDINAAATLTKDGDIDTLDILALYYAKNQWWHPDGLSGNYFTIQYKTKLKDSEYNALKSMPDGKTYTNTAYQVDSNGKTIKSKDKTVTATYDAVQKYDDSAQYLGNDDVIEYRVLVNKDASELNGGKNLTLTDVMSTDVDLNVSTVEIKDPSGNAIDGAKASYTERNRTLKITIPDRTYAVVTFKVRARDTGSKQYENSVTLQAQNTYTDKVSGNHNITGHGATIQGSADTVTINKFDRDDMSKVLPGAEFTLWKCEVGTDGTIDDNKKTVVGTYTTDAKGQVKFADLDQVCLYQFKETKAPAGYQKDDTVWNFILYNSDKSNQQQAWDLDTKIETKYKDQNMKVASIPDRYTWNMDNAAVEEGTIIINKTVAGLTDSEETDLWSKLTFTAKSTDTNKTEEYQSVYDPAKKTYTISGLTYDTYTITESGNAVSSYDMTVTGLSPATIDADHKVVEEDVTNTYTKNIRDLSIKKKVVGNAANLDKEFKVKVKLTLPSGTSFAKNANAGIGYDSTTTTATLTIRNGETKTIKNLPVGTTYTITEVDYKTSDGYDATYEGQTGTIKSDSDSQAVITNTKDTFGDLKISKTVTGNSVGKKEQEQVFTFRIALKDKDGNPLSGTYTVEKYTKTTDRNEDTKDGEGENLALGSDGTFTVQLHHNQYALVKNLPNGTQYSVTENPETGYVTTSSNVSGTIVGKDDSTNGNSNTYTVPEAAFTNRHDSTGDLVVTKTVTGNAGELTREFEFTVTLTDLASHTENPDASVTYGDMTFIKDVNGEYVCSFKLKNGEQKKATGIPNGVSYNVKETSADGYTTQVTTEKDNGKDKQGNEQIDTTTQTKNQIEGKISSKYQGDKAILEKFVNEKNLYGAFSLEKVLSGNSINGDENKEFNFTVTLYDLPAPADGENQTLKFGDTTFTYQAAAQTYTADVKLQAGERKKLTFTGVPNGVTYSIEEQEANTNGYITTYDKAQKVTVVGSESSKDAATTPDASNQAVVTNTRNGSGSLVINKIVEGNNTSANDEFKVHVVLKNPQWPDVNNTKRDYKVYTVGSQNSPAEDKITFTKVGNEDSYFANLFIKSNQQIKIENLPANAKAVVTETIDDTLKNNGYSLTPVVVYNDETAENQDGTTIADQTQKTVTITNKRYLYGGFKISKVTAGNDPDKKTWFAFKVTLSDKTINGVYGNIEFKNGVSVRDLDSSNDKIKGFVPNTAKNTDGSAKFDPNYIIVTTEKPRWALGLPAGIKYSVEEADYSKTYDKVEYHNANGTIAEISSDETIKNNIDSIPDNVTIPAANQVTVTNTRNRTGKLVIQKILAGNAASTADTFTFNIEAKTKDGANLSGTYSGVTFTDGNATVTLNGGKFKDGVTENNLTADYSNNGGVAKVIEGLPLGATFTVTESQVAGYEQTYFLSYKEQLYENGQKVQETVNGELKDKKKSVVTRGSNSGTISIDQRIVTVVNRRNEVTLSKKNLGGEKIGGAKLQIKDSQDNVVDIWTTDEGQDHKVVLTAGTYTLHEESAPEHYVAASDITFTVDEDGNVKIGEDSVDEVTMTDDYAYHDVEISKQNIAGNGLGNAKLQILDSNQNAVKGEDNKEIIWTSQADQNQTVQLKPGSYILREINAPENYAKDADIAFTVELDGTVKVNDKAADNHTLLMVDDYASHIVMISKADVGGELIPDAQMKVVDASGKDVDSWTTEKGQEKQLSLKPGNYILKEVKAPANYIKAQDIPFTVTVDGTVQINNRAQKDPKVRMVDQYTNHELKISKTDANGAILPGAVMVLSNTSGFNRRWTSKDKAESIIVKPGSYTLHEESAPQGYAAVSDYIISVSVDGKITLSDLKTGSKGILQSNEIELKNDVILVKDSVIPQKVVISKQDIGGNEIPGAFLTVTDMDGRQVGDTILTDGINKHEISLVPGTYTLTETTAPKGYKQAESILFTVGTDGKVAIKGDKTDGNEVVMVDNFVKGRIAVTKHSVTTDGRKLKGCGYILTTKQKVENKIVVSAIETDQISYYTGVDKDGTALWSDKEADAVEKVTGEDGIAVFEGVTIGEYTAYEKTAPKGYAVDTDPIKVNVIGTDLGNTDAEAHATAAAQADQRITKISKVDVTSKQELAGAHIQILDKNGNVVKDAFGNSMEWDSTTEAHEVVGLQTNVEYTLRETVAPNGYTVTSDTKFTIDDQDKVTGTASTTTDKDGNTVLLVEDAKTSVKISKVDITSGKELAGAHIQIIDKETGKVVEIDGKKVEWDSTSTAHEVTGLIAGKTYILRETVAPEGYDITTDTEFTLDQYGRITGTAAVKNGVILVQDAKTKKAVVTRKTGTAAPASRTSRVGGAQTGDTAPITAAAGILSAAVLVLAILIRRRKYTK